jgi:lysophospholipase L1-like esterase
MTAQRPSASTRIRFVIQRLALSACVTLVALEIGLRLIGWATLTLRARQPAAGTQQGPALRMLHLGESTTFGLGVRPDEAYPAVVAEILTARFPAQQFVSINRGVPGLVTSAMERTIGEKLAAVRPNLVTIMAGANDFNEELNGLRSAAADIRAEGLRRVVQNLRVYKFVWLGLQLARPDVRLEQGEVIYYHHGGSKNILYETQRNERKIAGVTSELEQNLRQIIGECRNTGATVALVGYIQAFEENTILMRVAKETGVTYVSTYLEPEARQRSLFTADGWHPSALGHRHIATRISDVVAPLIGTETQSLGPGAQKR